MKLLFTLTVLLTVTFSFGQNTFTTAISGFDQFSLYDLVQLSDGSYVGTGATYSKADSTAGIGIVKLGSDGHLIISRTIAPAIPNEDVEGASIIKTADGGVAVAGTISDTMALLKFDASLNLQWQKKYIASANYSYGNKLLQTSDGGYMVAGHLENDTDTSYAAAGYLVKTDAQGSVVWSKQYFDFNDANIVSVAATKDGNYALLASASQYPSNADTTYLIKINGTGDILWSKYISASLDAQSPTALISTSDGGFAVSGSIDRIYSFNSFDYRYAQVMLLRFDLNGSLLWSRASDDGVSNDINIQGLAADPNGGFILAGEFDAYDSLGISSAAKAYVIRVNSSGNLQFTKAISFFGAQENFYNILPTSDGTYAMAGNIYAFDDVNGNYDRGCFYKFNSVFATCGDVKNFGSLSDLGATVSTASPSVLNITTTAAANSITDSIAGSEISICNVLPVQLLSFGATLQNKAVNIEWKTANEINTDYFVVEKGSSASSFSALQKVTAKGDGSSAVQTYSTTDLQPLPGTSYYRLQQVDKNANITYSSTVSVTVSANRTIVISPNPVYGNAIKVLMQSDVSAKINFRITDITGKTLAVQNNQVNAGANTINIPAASLSKGVYLLKVTGNNSVQSVKFIKE